MFKELYKGIGKIAQGARTVASDMKDSTAQTIKEKGGLGQIVEDAVGTIGAGAGNVLGRINYLSMDLMEGDKDPSYISEGTKEGRELGSGIVRTIREFAGSEISEMKQAASETMFDPNERIFTSGQTEYTINTLSKETLYSCIAYMGQVARKIPSQTQGRTEVLKFIAENAIGNYEDFQKAWEKTGLEYNATNHLKPEQEE